MTIETPRLSAMGRQAGSKMEIDSENELSASVSAPGLITTRLSTRDVLRSLKFKRSKAKSAVAPMVQDCPPNGDPQIGTAQNGTSQKGTTQDSATAPIETESMAYKVINQATNDHADHARTTRSLGRNTEGKYIKHEVVEGDNRDSEEGMRKRLRGAKDSDAGSVGKRAKVAAVSKKQEDSIPQPRTGKIKRDVDLSFFRRRSSRNTPASASTATTTVDSAPVIVADTQSVQDSVKFKGHSVKPSASGFALSAPPSVPAKRMRNKKEPSDAPDVKRPRVGPTIKESAPESASVNQKDVLTKAQDSKSGAKRRTGRPKTKIPETVDKEAKREDINENAVVQEQIDVTTQSTGGDGAAGEVGSEKPVKGKRGWKPKSVAPAANGCEPSEDLTPESASVNQKSVSTKAQDLDTKRRPGKPKSKVSETVDKEAKREAIDEDVMVQELNADITAQSTGRGGTAGGKAQVKGKGGRKPKSVVLPADGCEPGEIPIQNSLQVIALPSARIDGHERTKQEKRPKDPDAPIKKRGRPPKGTTVEGTDMETKQELIEESALITGTILDAVDAGETGSATLPNVAPKKKRGRPSKAKAIEDIDKQIKSELSADSTPVMDVAVHAADEGKSTLGSKPNGTTTKRRGRPPKAKAGEDIAKETGREGAEESIPVDVVMVDGEEAAIPVVKPQAKGKRTKELKDKPNGEYDTVGEGSVSSSLVKAKGKQGRKKKDPPAQTEGDPEEPASVSARRRPGRKPRNAPPPEESQTVAEALARPKPRGRAKFDGVVLPGQPRWSIIPTKGARKSKVTPKVFSMKVQGKMKASDMQPRVWCSSREELNSIQPEFSNSKLVNGITWEMSETPVILLAEDVPITLVRPDEVGRKLDITLTRDFVCTEMDLIHENEHMVNNYGGDVMFPIDEHFSPFHSNAGPSRTSKSTTVEEPLPSTQTREPFPASQSTIPPLKTLLSPKSIATHKPRSWTEADEILDHCIKRFKLDDKIPRRAPSLPALGKLFGSSSHSIGGTSPDNGVNNALPSAPSSGICDGVQKFCFCSRFRFDPSCRKCHPELDLPTRNQDIAEDQMKEDKPGSTDFRSPIMVPVRAASAPPALQPDKIAFQPPSPSIPQASTVDKLPSSLPDELQVLYNAFYEAIPVSLVASRAKFMQHWKTELPEEYAFVYLGYFRIRNIQQRRVGAPDAPIPSPGMVTGRGKWTFELEWGDGGEQHVFPTPWKYDNLEYPWWSPSWLPDSSSESNSPPPMATPVHSRTSFRETGFSLVPLSLLVEFGYHIADDYFPRGWHCPDCGKLNFQDHLRHRKCTSVQCFDYHPLPEGYVHELSTVRATLQSLPMTLPYNTYPRTTIDGNVSEWQDDMVTISYFPLAEPTSYPGMTHIFTRNIPRLQADPTRLLIDLQKHIPMRRELGESKPYFVYGAGVGEKVGWDDAPQVVADARKLMKIRVLEYGEMKESEVDFDKLRIWGWVTAGTKRGDELIKAKKHPVVIMCLGCDASITATPMAPVQALSDSNHVELPAMGGLYTMDGKAENGVVIQNGDVFVGGGVVEAEQDAVVAQQHVSPEAPPQGMAGGSQQGMEDISESAPTAKPEEGVVEDIPAVATEAPVVRGTGRGRASKAEGETIVFSMIHGDVLVLSGDDFQFSIKRSGTSILLIGCHSEEM